MSRVSDLSVWGKSRDYSNSINMCYRETQCIEFSCGHQEPYTDSKVDASSRFVHCSASLLNDVRLGRLRVQSMSVQRSACATMHWMLGDVFANVRLSGVLRHAGLIWLTCLVSPLG